jgi:hypothetical protein
MKLKLSRHLFWPAEVLHWQNNHQNGSKFKGLNPGATGTRKYKMAKNKTFILKATVFV